MQCAICHDDVTAETGRTVLSCGHEFHLVCVVPWLQKPDGSGNCPCCRKEPTELERLVPAAADSDSESDSESESDSDSETVGGSTPLIEAIREGNVAEARRIIASCTTDLDEEDSEGYTALYLAVYYNQEMISRMLLTAGASLLALGPTLNNALFTACIHNSMVCIQACLAQGADINCAQPLTGNTPLMEAIRSDHPIAMAAFLISMGANVAAVDAKGWNAVMWAALRQCDLCGAMTLLLKGTALEPRIKESVAATKVQALWRGFRVRRPRLRRGIRGHVRFMKCFYNVRVVSIGIITPIIRRFFSEVDVEDE